MKRAGTWSLHPIQMYPGYFFVATCDVLALNDALSKLSFHVELVGARERACVPLQDQAKAFFEQVADGAHVIRSSAAVIEDGSLRVLKGPLVGLEYCIVKVDRHKRRCWVRIGGDEGGFIEVLPLDVPHKS